MVACPSIFFTASYTTRLVELHTQTALKDIINRDMASFHISPQSWEALAADRNRWRAPLSYGYSLSATSYTEKMEKCRAHRLQRRDGP